MTMCNQTKCDYGHQCRDCAYYIAEITRHTRTGLDTSDMRAYKREYMRRRRAEQLLRDMEAAGVV